MSDTEDTKVQQDAGATSSTPKSVTKMNVDELQHELRAKNQSTTGKKAVLVERAALDAVWRSGTAG